MLEIAKDRATNLGLQSTIRLEELTISQSISDFLRYCIDAVVVILFSLNIVLNALVL
jgi:hypothetical protein